MKKTVLTIMVLALLASCGGNKKQNTDEIVEVQETEVVIDSIGDHNAQNSLDYVGLYKGTIPAASGSGIDVTVELGDSTYVRTSLHSKGNQAPDKTVEQGKYTWKADGNTIVLENADKGSTNEYFVAEGYIMTLDTEGNKIEGEMAELYNLKKQ